MDESIRLKMKEATLRGALTEGQKAELRKFSSKTLGMIGVLAAGCAIAAVFTGVDSIVIYAVIFFILAVIMLLLELKDKLKLRKFEEIYAIPAYVEKVFPVNKGKQARVQYYDLLVGLFVPKTIRLDRMDDIYSVAVKGAVIPILVGVKKGKLRYIGPKPAKV